MSNPPMITLGDAIFAVSLCSTIFFILGNIIGWYQGKSSKEN